MLITPFSSKFDWVSDRVRKLSFAVGHIGFWGLIKFIFASINYRINTFFIRWKVLFDAKILSSKVVDIKMGKGLFIDCGSNVGQGFTYFRKFYPLKLYDYILVEPNPNCLSRLRWLCQSLGGHVEIIGEAASIKEGEACFYGLSEGGGDEVSEGGSLIRAHNGVFYEASDRDAIKVRTFSLSDLIRSKHSEYSSIILKLDIEGGEYEVLDDLISKGSHLLLDAAYVEFHSQYMLEPKRSIFKLKEVEIRKKFENDHILFRLWI